jgi:hypothetical protein
MKNILFIPAIACLAFAGISASAQSGSQTFTSSGVFTVPAGVTAVTVEVVGAGGSGGGNGGGGGGGGGYALGTFSVTPLSTHNITVGTAGGGSLAGTTNIGAVISATGGANGTSVPNPNIGGGGAGGIGTGGTILNRTGGNGGGGYWTYFGGGGGGAAGLNANGSAGGNAIVWTGVCLFTGGIAGPGGGAPGGDGGKGAGFIDPNCQITHPSGDGVNYGGGGGGGNGNGGQEGTGAGGYCRVSWDMYVGIKGITPLKQCQVSPNPVTDRIVVMYTIGNETYELTDAAGRMIWKGTHIELQDFSVLKSGIYLLKVMDNDSMEIIKVLK